MRSGTPLDDDDRFPWLLAIRATAEAYVDCGEPTTTTTRGVEGVVVACSALKRSYRDVLRGRAGMDQPTYFVFMEGSREMVMKRMRKCYKILKYSSSFEQ